MRRARTIGRRRTAARAKAVRAKADRILAMAQDPGQRHAMADPRIGQLLDAAPWAGETPRLALLDFEVVLRTDDAALASYLSDLFASVHHPDPYQRATSMLSLVFRRGEYLVHLDGVRMVATP